MEPAGRAVRLVPEVPLPPYSFVPGQTPHPRSDPAGHSYGRPSPPPPPLDPARWAESQAYLFGFDLFNHGFFWEAHETWEGLWHAAGRRGPLADFLKGLIKLAAAGVKHREGTPAGIRSHAARAAELWRGVIPATGAALFLGLPLLSLISLAEDITKNGWPDPPPILVPSG
jgi:hypothetical protein